MRHVGSRHSERTNSGTTLVEMLVAVVLLSAGMVAVAGMLNDSMNSLAGSSHQQRAAQLGNNLGEVLSGLHANTAWPMHVPGNFHCEMTPCNPAELLADSLDDWQRQIKRLLPGGRGQFTFTADHGQPVIEIQIEWQTRSGNTADMVTVIPVSAETAAP